MSSTPFDGLAGMPPGPGLGARLAVIDARDLSDEQLPALLSAQWRQLAFQQAQTWAVMAEIGSRDPLPKLPGGARWSAAEVFDAGVDEIRAELVVTRRFAGEELASACMVAGLPRVMQALAAGVIDRARALAFAEGCFDLTGAQAEVLLDELLPEAAEVTASGLAERISKVAMALDPGWAERRYRQAVRERRVVGYLNRDGSATLAGQNLPADDAAAACARVDALADAAKRAGAAAKIDHLRAELFLGLLDGRFHGLSEPAIIAELIRLFPKPDQPAEQATAITPEQASDDVAGLPRGSHLRVGLGTLLGIDDEPGELAGLGTVTAAVARRIAARQRRCEWRYAILDPDGQLLVDGITRRRPRDPRAGSPNTDARQRRGGIVELHVPLTLLTDPAVAGQHPDWARLLADLAAQHARQKPIEQDPTARFAGRPLRRRQQTRFQRCLFPGCRRPAADCDLDHRREHAQGGATDQANLAPGCRHDYGLKTSRGWRLIRRDETFVWISPLGRKHQVTLDPIAAPLPKPIPRLLPPDRDFPDDPDPGSAFQRLDQRGRPVESRADPPP